MQKTETLTLKQRVILVLVYIIVFILITKFYSGSFEFLYDPNSIYNQLFVSIGLLLVFGAYIAEPFFTKPTDVLVNATGIFLFLLSVDKKKDFIGYEALLLASAILILITLILILYSSKNKESKIASVFVDILVKIGKSKVSYSVIYLATLFSYFRNDEKELAVFFSFWAIFITGYLFEGLLKYIIKVYYYIFSSDHENSYIGEAIGYENPFVFKVEVDLQKNPIAISRGDLVCVKQRGELDSLGVVVDQKSLLNKKWLTVYLLREKGAVIKLDKISAKTLDVTMQANHSVHKIEADKLPQDLKDVLNTNYLFENKKGFIGYVHEGSDINKIQFYILPNFAGEEVTEGTIVASFVNKKKVFFQVIDANTREEGLEKYDKHSFISVTARKLGEYNPDRKELISVRWLPEMYSPVFLTSDDSVIPDESKLIGYLPNTKLPIEVKDVNSLVTHNTAVLGILGIGKSYLTFELIKQVIINTSAKVICIDITNEYIKKLPSFIDINLIESQVITDAFITNLKETSRRTGNESDPNTWGNCETYESKLTQLIKEFSDSDKRVLVLNPDWHAVAEAATKKFKITNLVELTVAQKARIITERLFIQAKHEWEENETTSASEINARFLLVFEEAHSLIPEWNSASNDGDKNAANGTAKVILQGRKYGLGSIVVTQRTANISKSILNQCNTIFALRVFDDTGKEFLENYIGSDYSNTLPTLEERHAIVVGKALALKQPVIIKIAEFNT